LPAVLETLKLKDLKAMVADDLTHPPLNRKTQAVAYALSLPDVKERIGKVAAVQDLFQLQPLPAEFAHVDLNASPRHGDARGIAFLITATYTQAYDTVEQKHLHKELDPEIVGGKFLLLRTPVHTVSGQQSETTP
jgi:hypothetical protein